ncbi:hypothetical protein BGZ70_005777 [Mortierella alpina]|uniref:Uncharacterized protein n=1 Tax=Mortierella alpina TaxID=64518 RepID=A0A9P6M453_MORAP|nr:hypothetical protein BGZ70_005777 [Mortierella alpina]
MDNDIDTLEVLLNQSLIKTKISALPRDQAYKQGRRLLQDLLSIARFGTPAIVPIETPFNSNHDDPSHGDDTGQQTMQLSERQGTRYSDMLLGQACKVYHYASLTLDDIFDQVPPPNQLCLVITMMLLVQKSNSEIASLIVQEPPFDPLTMFQRWILRTRVAGAEPLGLDLGDSKYHAEALQEKLAGLSKLPESPRILCIQCQISSELGQYYCWNGQHEEAIKCLSQCQEVHRQHSTLEADDVRCHLNLVRIEALSKLARLAVGTPLEAPKDNLLNRVKALEIQEQHDVLVDEFFLDNKARNLPYAWRQCTLRSVLNRGDMENGTFLAIANALYQLAEPSQMMLSIPTQVLHFLRTIIFEGGHEADAYLCSSIFEDIMKVIADAEAAQMGDSNKRKIKGFVTKFCASVGHVLCYEAAWTSGLLLPNSSDWSRIWQAYSYILVREGPLLITNSTTDGMSEDEILARILELMDPDDIERYLLSKDLPHLTCSLTVLALSAQANDRNQFLERVRFLQSAARFLEKHEAKYLVMFKQIEYKLQEFTAMSKLGILAMEHEERREARTIARLEHKIHASLLAQASVRAEKNEDAMEVDGETLTTVQDNLGLTDEEQAREQEKTREICDLLKQFLESYGVLEQDLQLRCLAICINGKQWEFLSGYCRAAVAVVDRNAHPEICQVYNILVPLAEIMSISQNLGVDFKDITSAHCLDALVSTNMADILNVLRLASWDLIHGLLPIATRPPPRMEDDPASSEGQDHGHAAILKLFGMVRLRGIVDIFGALVAGTLTSILPPKEKLTLSEFGYHALFTTTLESTSSWTDDRIKSIVALSNGDSARAIRGIPGAVVRFVRLLTQLYERQIQFETNTLTTKLKIETDARAKAASLAGVDPLRSGSSGSNATPLFSTKAAASLVRYSLCLTDIYYLEGKHQDALASFLNACMMCSKGFADAERLKRRVWSAYNNGFSLSSAVTPATQTILPSQGGPLPGAEVMGVQSFQSLTSLSNMGGAHPANGHPPTAVGLGLSSPSPGDGNGSFNMPGTMSPTPIVPSQQLMPGPMAPYNAPGSQPSTFALRAIECCIQLNESLAGVLMYQFLPRIDYAQVYAVIRSAYEKGLLVASGAPPTISSRVTSMPPLSMNAGPTLTPPMLHPGPHVPGMNPAYQQSPNGTPLMGSAGVSGPPAAAAAAAAAAALAASPRVYTSVSVFTPEFKKSAEDTKPGRRGSLLPPISRRDAVALDPAFTLQQFLELMFDLPMLERTCHHFKTGKDEEGMMKVRTRINSNRLALDLRQPFRDQVQALAQQDLLSRLWSRYARMG